MERLAPECQRRGRRWPRPRRARSPIPSRSVTIQLDWVDGGIFFLNSRAGFMNESGVKLRRFCLSVVAALVLVSPAVRSQLIEGGAKRFKHAFVDEQTGKRTMLLTGGSATNISNEELLIGDGVRLQFFDDTGKTNLEVASAACIYNLKTESVASTNRLEASSGSGQFSLEGDGFEYARANGSLTISNHIHATIRKDLLQSPSQTTATRGAGQSGRQTEAAPATNQFLQIFSDRMRYQSNLAVFECNVRVEDPQGKMTCSALTVAFSERSPSDESRRIESIVARQQVVIDSDQVHASGDQATYRQATEVIELTGNPAWRLRQYEGRAEELVVNRRTREFHARRNVEMTLPPGSIGQSGFLLPESSSETTATAAEGQPAQVRAGDFEFKPDVADTNFNLAVFRGNVQVNSGKGNLGCELMTIISTAQSNRTESVVAERSVVMEQGDNRVTGEKAVYTATNALVEVTGNPEWKMSQREGTSEVLAFDLKNRAYHAARNVRMRLPTGALGASTWLPSGSAARTNVAASGTSTDPPKPIEVASDDFELKPDAANTNLSLATYRGHVRASEPEQMNLASEELTVTGKMLLGTNQVERVVAEGNVELVVRESGGEKRAQGDKAVYTAGNGEVVLTSGNRVKFVVADAQGVIEGSGSKAVYTGAPGVLELSGNNPVLTAGEGKVWGDPVIWDRANTTLKATGNWKVKLNPESLKKKATPALPKS
ncbi:MAG: hypothetical protein DME21_03775 [Verrucomicrobia bacterium]|nr:MAG: hypothetical protein DME21_03775 [Verrucomicrobiota bacterium]